MAVSVIVELGEVVVPAQVQVERARRRARGNRRTRWQFPRMTPRMTSLGAAGMIWVFIELMTFLRGHFWGLIATRTPMIRREDGFIQDRAGVKILPPQSARSPGIRE